MHDALLGQRVLITQARDFMGPMLCEVFAEQGAEVIASPEALAEPDAARRVVEGAGRIDVLVANLAFEAPSTPALEVGEAEWREVFAALVDPLPRLISAAAPAMVARRSGKVLVIGSASALRGMKRASTYSAARGAQLDAEPMDITELTYEDPDRAEVDEIRAFALGLHALQHRGQEAAGITSMDASGFHSHRAQGHVAGNFDRDEVIRALQAALLYVRWNDARLAAEAAAAELRRHPATARTPVVAVSADGGLSQRMFGTLLSWMQDHRSPIFLVATANNIASLPPETPARSAKLRQYCGAAFFSIPEI